MSQQQPGGVTSIAYSVAGERVVGIFYHASGAEPHPAAILVHGIPGSEKNHDIAYALREAGWHALILHVRGAWGSEGRYEMAGQVDDTRGALDWLLGPDNPFAVNAARVALVGYSLGSRAALLAAAHDERVRAVASISGIEDFAGLDLGADFFAESARVLTGVTGPDLHRQWASLARVETSTDAIRRLQCPLLIVHGEEDEVVPVDHGRALAAAVQDIDVTLASMPAAGHLFAAHRAEVVQTVLDWLEKALPG